MQNDPNRIKISSIPEISAIYFALLQCGYDYYAAERNNSHTDHLKRFIIPQPIPDFFHAIKQDTCQVYPYWPRAAILESAVFALKADLTDYSDLPNFKAQIMAASNILDVERDQRLWNWIDNFPGALKAVISSEQFQTYYNWEQAWIALENSRCQESLNMIGTYLESCINKYGSSIRDVQIVINPIKCVYSADYHIVGEKMIVISGALRPDSIVHELLHSIVHPVIIQFRDIIRNQKPFIPDIDPSYYLSGSNNGFLNAYEEYAVRKLTYLVLKGEHPESIHAFLQQLIRLEAKEIKHNDSH